MTPSDAQNNVRHFQLLEELGAGGMGTVYRGLDTRTNAPVAIKQLKPDLTTPELIERFKREGEALRDLNHPNIVKMLDAVEVDGSHFLVMEYLPGGDLKKRLDGEKLPIKMVLQLAIDICDALTRAHRLDIIHRDLKPANVLIADDGTPRLTDFGIAHIGAKANITETNAIMGTIDYLSPEALNGDTIDARADIWAFGVMLFEMLAGERPFKGKGIVEVIHAISTHPIPDLEQLCPDAPVGLVDLIYRMLEREPNARISSVRHVGAALEDIAKGRNTPVSHMADERGRFDTPPHEFIGRAQHNLSAQTTPFVGRDDELAELAKLLTDPTMRLITLLAPGGMGKTRLALEAGEKSLPHFEDGVFFVDLAPLSSGADSDSIVSTVADAVSYQFQGGERAPKQQLLDFLSQKTLLLIMDNYEHVLNTAGLVTELLHAAPNINILATSRGRLSQPGEILFHLHGMAFPEWETPEDALDYAAVKLFMNSGKRARPDFELTADNLDYVARICRLVEGMPLGIVLAASWLAMLTPQEIAGEIMQGIDFLATEEIDLPERQRSIRVAMDYSWGQMTDAEQQVFMKLSVFRGGFTREAAEVIAGASLRSLMLLVNKSLLKRDAASGRYDIHELLRQYAAGRLEAAGMLDAALDAHAQYFVHYMSEQWPLLKSQQLKQGLDLIDADIENIRAAWLRSVERGQVLDLRETAKSLWIYSDLSNHHNALALLEKAEQALVQMKPSDVRNITLGHIRARQAWHLNGIGQHEAAYWLAEEAIALLKEYDCPEETSMGYQSLIITANFSGRLDKARLAAEQALTHAKSTRHVWGEAHALYWFGISYIHGDEGDYERAVEIGHEALNIARTGADTFITAAITGILLGVGLQALNRKDEARAMYQQGLQLFSGINHKWGIASCHENLGELALTEQDYNQSLEHFSLAFQRRVADGYDWISVGTAVKIVRVLFEAGEGILAAQVLGGISAYEHLDDWFRDQITNLQASLKPMLEPMQYAEAWERGSNMGFKKATLEALDTFTRTQPA